MKWLSRLQRIYQPANPLFWLMLMLNSLSFALSWIVQNRALNALGMLLVGTFALVNAMVGTWLMWRLMQAKPAAVPEATPAATPAATLASRATEQ